MGLGPLDGNDGHRMSSGFAGLLLWVGVREGRGC